MTAVCGTVSLPCCPFNNLSPLKIWWTNTWIAESHHNWRSQQTRDILCKNQSRLSRFGPHNIWRRSRSLSLLGLSPSRANNPACKQAVSFTHFPTNVIPVTGMSEGRISKMQLLVGGEEVGLWTRREWKKKKSWCCALTVIHRWRTSHETSSMTELLHFN